MYRTNTPRRWTKRVTTLYRVPPGVSLDEAASASDTAATDSDTTQSEGLLHNVAEMEVENEPLASIHWKTFRASQVDQGSQTVSVHELLARAGPLKTSYSFRGLDGSSYHWNLGVLGTSSPVLTLGDENHTVVAKHHSGELFGQRKPSIEIFPLGEQNLDHVIMTFLYVEKRRRDRLYDPKSLP